MKQEIITKETEEGYSIEILHDGKVVWIDNYKTKSKADWLLYCLKTGFGKIRTLDEAKNEFENGEYQVNILYRHPLGYRFTWIFNNDVIPEKKETGYTVFFVNKDDVVDDINVPTMEEAFDIIKKVENGIM